MPASERWYVFFPVSTVKNDCVVKQETRTRRIGYEEE
jgi:hypothetical protein